MIIEVVFYSFVGFQAIFWLYMQHELNRMRKIVRSFTNDD